MLLMRRNFKSEIPVTELNEFGYQKNDPGRTAKISDSLGEIRTAYHMSTYRADAVNAIVSDKIGRAHV